MYNIFIISVNSLFDFEDEPETKLKFLLDEEFRKHSDIESKYKELISDFKNIMQPDLENISELLINIEVATEHLFKKINNVLMNYKPHSKDIARINKLMRRTVVFGAKYINNFERVMRQVEIDKLNGCQKEPNSLDYERSYRCFFVVDSAIIDWSREIILENIPDPTPHEKYQLDEVLDCLKCWLFCQFIIFENINQ
ncbi:hypothetical protein CDIK_4004 [Cucumispora dikerogammari]|nr:hypothetical protein CDIK_4004 [Cucumispora dikerogammari]